MSTLASDRAVAPAARPRQPHVIEVEAYDPAHEAHGLSVAGLGWREIAQHTGYASAEIARMAVTAYLQRAAVAYAPEVRQAALQTELDRLDAVHGAFWARTMDGDAMAAAVVLKVSDRRCQLLGLDHPSEPERALQQTVVIGGTSEQYLGALRSVVDGTAFGEPR